MDQPLDLEERLANLISDGIRPRLLPELEILPWRRTHLLAVQVYPSPGRPHYLSREGPDRGVYVRVGSTNRRADTDLVEELRRYARGETFDEQPMPQLDSEAVDFRAASEPLPSRTRRFGSSGGRTSKLCACSPITRGFIVGRRIDYDVACRVGWRTRPTTEDELNLVIEIEREEDDRWLAEISDLPGVMTYGRSRAEAIARVQALALRVLAERLEHGEAAPDLLAVSFQAA